MGANGWSAGDWLIYRKPKRSVSPGPRARDVVPARSGESYRYTVEKYWVVREVEDDHLLVQTRRGKQHRIEITDSLIRKPRWWERWLLRGRFEAIENSIEQEPLADNGPN